MPKLAWLWMAVLVVVVLLTVAWGADPALFWRLLGRFCGAVGVLCVACAAVALGLWLVFDGARR